ncbi:MAG: hypothetical protein Alpg2KO_13790 [Alphaproteobacteria bacterium]
MSHPTELQIQIDDVYSCPGNCAGCMLSTTERRISGPDMAEDVRLKSIERLGEYIDSLPRLDRLNITWGLADHLMMDDDYIARIYEEASALIRRHNPKERAYSAVFFSTAIIGRQELIEPRLEKLAALSRANEVPLIPIVILDPALANRENYGPTYKALILKAKKLFGKVDLSINISDPAIRLISGPDLVAFTADHGFDEITINWVPTDGNAKFTASDLDYMADWLISVDEALRNDGRIDCSFRPVLLRSIHGVACGREHPLRSIGYARAANDFVPPTIAKSIQIDHDGNLLPKFEAIGDVPHAPRFGFPHLGSVLETPIADLLQSGLPRVAAQVVKAHARTHACQNCEVADICATTGFHVFNHIIEDEFGRSETDCPSVARRLITHYFNQAKLDDPGATIAAE